MEGNHAQLGGGSVTEILMSALAYGWVEHCNDIAGCGTRLFQDKYSGLCLTLQLYFLINDHEHVSCLNKMNVACFMSMNNMYVLNKMYLFCCRLHYAPVNIFMLNAFLNCVMGLRLLDG